MTFTAFVSYPDAPLTETLIKQALNAIAPDTSIIEAFSEDAPPVPLLQWATYDLISHPLTLSLPSTTLSSCYTIRKSLIRKHYLHRTLQHYLAKNPDSLLHRAVPKTWDVELSYADELDEMWSDELYDLGEDLPETSGEDESRKWFILKPGMSDRGMGIRIFDSKDSLRGIFEEFEERSDDGSGESDGEALDEDKEDATKVVTSQLRHFVIQEYLTNPLLISPSEIPITATPSTGTNVPNGQGHKFHLRAYCVASGALRLFLYPRILALFSSKPYAPPAHSSEDGPPLDLSVHLTNTSLQTEQGETYVRLLSELIGARVLSGTNAEQRLTQQDVESLVDQVADVLAETFRPALSSAVHFQPLPNAFELFGADLLVTHDPSSPERPFQVSILELNAEPAIHLTGPRLNWILEELFLGIGKTCVKPFFEPQKEKQDWKVGETKDGLRLCLDVEVRGARGW